MFLLTRSGTTWTQQAKLLANDRAANDRLGRNVALSGNYALVGAHFDDDNGADSGSAYLFERSGDSWSRQVKLTAPDGAAGDYFGYSIAFDGLTALVGAYLNDDPATDSGSAYGYTVTPPPTPKILLHAIRDPKGNSATLSYSSERLTRVTGPSGQRWLDFGYDAQNRLVSLSDHAGRQVLYGYDVNDNLTSVTDTRGYTWTYTYTATLQTAAAGDHMLHQVIDPESKVVERTFYQDINGQTMATRQENGAGNPVVQVDYQPSGSRTVTQMGSVTTDVYDNRNLLVKQSDALGRDRTYSLDSHFNRTQATDPRGNPVHYQRDQWGLTRAITDALTNVTHFSYDPATNNLTGVTDANQTTFNYSYDPQAPNNLLQISTPSGNLSYSYNAWGQVTAATNRRNAITQYGYDTLGNLTVITNALNQPTHLAYDTLGRVTRLTNGRGMVTLFDYDPAGNLTRLTENYQTGACDPTECNLETGYDYDPAGRLLWLTNPDNRRTKYEYDAAGRLEKIIRNFVDGVYTGAAPDEDIATRYQYDSFSRLQSIFETLAQGQERETRLTYDLLNRVQQVILNYQDGVYNAAQPDQDIITNYQYTDQGSQAIVTVTAPDGVAARFEYDELGRLAKVIANYQTTTCPANECNLTTAYEYDPVGNLIFVTNPQSLITNYQYDPLNRLTAVIENYTGNGTYAGIPDENVTTGYQYDAEGNLEELTINQLPITNYQYDALNRVNQQANALGHIWEYDYDPAGNLTQITDPKLQITNYQYDLLNRLTLLDYPAPNSDVTLGYDQLGNRTQMSDATGTTGYQYDALNRLEVVSSPQGTVSYGYDARGNRTRLTYPDTQGGTGGKTINYSYDDADRLETLTPSWDSGSYVYSYANHRLSSLTRPTGLQTSYGYDSAGRLNHLAHTKDAIPLVTYDYWLDAVGNLTQAVEILFNPPTYYFPIILKDGSASGQQMLAEPADSAETTFTSPLARPAPSEEAPTPTGVVQFTPTAAGASEPGPTVTQEPAPGPTQEPAPAQTTTPVVVTTVTPSPAPTATLAPTPQAITLEALLEALDAAHQAGQVEEKLYGSLRKKLQRAQSDLTGGQSQQAIQTLQLFTNQLKGEPAESIAPDAAQTLSQMAEALITQLQAQAQRPAGLAAPLPPGAPAPLLPRSPAAWLLDALTAFWADLTAPTRHPDAKRVEGLPLVSPALFTSPIGGQGLDPIPYGTTTITYTYDSLYRLAEANYTVDPVSGPLQTPFFHYSYDARGNRLQMTNDQGQTTNYVYDAANRLTSVNGQSYTYDDNGNLLSDGARTYGYDSANRLTSVLDNGVISQYAYNGDGDRLSQTVGGVTTGYIFDPVGLAQVLAETTNGQSTFYVPGLAQYGVTGWQYFGQDRLGSVRTLLDPAGKLIAARNYDPFGNVLTQGGEGNSAFGYTGEQVDAIGLVYLRARYYAPTVGRFLTPDTIVPNPLSPLCQNK